MNCNMELHESLIESGDIVCPFCNQNLEDSDEKPRDRSAKYYLCCDCQDIINNDGMIVCRSCGIVQGYETAREYVETRKKQVTHSNTNPAVCSTLRMRTAISPWQWQPWTAVSSLLGLISMA